MTHKKRSISVVMVLTFLIFMGMVATGFSQQQGQLLDLTIEDITLNEQCFVVVKVKNNGPGTVPDKVWTLHEPDSSAVYLHINGKKWGGETIWYFDPDKNLQNPGGTATMVSNLKVTGPDTINATIDNTGKVREENEKNNQMRKKLSCQPGVSAQLRVKAQLGVNQAAYTGNCPALISFRGHITVNQPTTLQYKFIRSDNAQAPVQTLNFPKAGTQEVTTTWQLGGAGLPAYSGWEAIQVISPVSVESNKAEFRIRCAGQVQPGQQGGPGQQTGKKAGVTAQPGVGKEECISFHPATTTVQH